LAYTQLEKRYLELQTENGYITAELLRAREQLADFANAENNAATRLADLQKKYELEGKNKLESLVIPIKNVC
jgi:hypothetical protein